VTQLQRDSLPRDSWQEAWQLAVDLAVEDLAAADLAERSLMSGATWKADEQVVEIACLNRSCRLASPDFEIQLDGGPEADIRERILLLHYLQTANGSALTGTWKAFSEIPGAQLYLANFQARSGDRLARAFGSEPHRLLEAAHGLAGVESDIGDAGVRIPALPRAPVLTVVWGGDDEFPPSGDVLFDSSITDYLPTEDIIVLAEKVVTRLCRPEGEGKS